MKRLAVLIISLALPVAAQDGPSMTGEEFRDLAEGYTLHFEDETGRYFGSEQYLPDAQTIWRPSNGECERGVWAADRGRICFLYVVGIACWKLYRDGDDVLALSANGDDGAIDENPTRLRLKDRNNIPVSCEVVPSV